MNCLADSASFLESILSPSLKSEFGFEASFDMVASFEMVLKHAQKAVRPGKK
jgi:hypothetical protein